MRQNMRSKSLLVLSLVLFLVSPALAGQSPETPPKPFRGTVKTLKGETLVIMSPNGRAVSFTLAPHIKITANVKRSIDDIKPGDFVGTAGIEKGGKLYAQEVHIFPPDMRGTGEGQHPMGPNPAHKMTNATVSAVQSAPKRSMTNATVSGISGGPGSRILKLKYKGGEAETIVGPHVPIVALVPGNRSLLKPGAAVLVFAVKTDKGLLMAVSINAEKNRVMPL